MSQRLKWPSLSDKKREAGAYTLIEIMVAMAIVAVLVGASVPALRGWQEMNRLRSPSSTLFNLVHEARSLAFNENQPYVIILNDEGFTLKPQATRRGEADIATKTYTLPAGTRYKIRRWWEREWHRPDGREWLFRPQSLTEPLSFRFERDDQYLEQTYHPVTASIFNESLVIP